VPLPRFLVDELARTVVNRPSAAMTLDRSADLFDDDLDDVADRLDALRAAARGQVHVTEETQARRPVHGVETRGIEPLTPALQRRCSAN
jgi:hypothetical protein